MAAATLAPWLTENESKNVIGPERLMADVRVPGPDPARLARWLPDVPTPADDLLAEVLDSHLHPAGRKRGEP